jgi:hypothetical protein
MDNQIVDVQFEDGTVSICQIIDQVGSDYIVSELICKRDGTCKFSDDTCPVAKDAVCGFYDVTKLEDTELFRRVSGNVYETIYDSDEDYEASTDEDIESESDISLDDDEEEY